MYLKLRKITNQYSIINIVEKIVERKKMEKLLYSLQNLKLFQFLMLLRKNLAA